VTAETPAARSAGHEVTDLKTETAQGLMYDRQYKLGIWGVRSFRCCPRCRSSGALRRLM